MGRQQLTLDSVHPEEVQQEVIKDVEYAHESKSCMCTAAKLAVSHQVMRHTMTNE